MKATLTSKGQITIPRAIRKKLDLAPGTVLEFGLLGAGFTAATARFDSVFVPIDG
jgi:AbrB family looped-hinge helix DNA binding protein